MGSSVSTSSLASRLQNRGPFVPSFVGQMPCIVQASFCDGNMQALPLRPFIHRTHSEIGQFCAKMTISMFGLDLRSLIGELMLRMADKRKQLELVDQGNLTEH